MYEISWRSSQKREILMRLRYFGRKCERDILVGVMVLCEKERDLPAGTYVLFGLADLERENMKKGVMSRKIIEIPQRMSGIHRRYISLRKHRISEQPLVDCDLKPVPVSRQSYRLPSESTWSRDLASPRDRESPMPVGRAGR